MFKFDDGRVGRIEELNRKIADLENGNPLSNRTGYWGKLFEICSKFSSDQLNYIDNDKRVIESKNRMMEAFNLFLFEKFKEDFAKIENYKSYCENYINEIINAGSDFSNNINDVVNENIELKKRIKEFEELINESNNAK